MTILVRRVLPKESGPRRSGFDADGWLTPEDREWLRKREVAAAKRKATIAANKAARKLAGCMTDAETFKDIKSAYFDWLDKECPSRHDYAGRKEWLRSNKFTYDGREWEMISRSDPSNTRKTWYRSTHFISGDREIACNDTGHRVSNHGYEYYVGPVRDHDWIKRRNELG